MYIYKISNDLQYLSDEKPCPGLSLKSGLQNWGVPGTLAGLLRVRIKKGPLLWSLYST